MRLLENLMMAVMGAVLNLHNFLQGMKAHRHDDHYTAEVKALRRGWFYSLVIGLGTGVVAMAVQHFLDVVAAQLAPATGLMPLQQGVSLIAGVMLLSSALSMAYFTYRLVRVELF
ncbi:hypothetical protein [Pelomonas sp. Root1444]|uniref:hypothetical protein n=1 Tax=Pelomonas sp. Root1444 TaxID=1736464 RepID=UPI000703A83D|nr:hypothetical protein [Pelomonas sp. Root1444]KQY80847.1 hypothetical protein ASD35_03075 [Pelomonas sp. Root1444]